MSKLLLIIHLIFNQFIHHSYLEGTPQKHSFILDFKTNQSSTCGSYDSCTECLFKTDSCGYCMDKDKKGCRSNEDHCKDFVHKKTINEWNKKIFPSGISIRLDQGKSQEHSFTVNINEFEETLDILYVFDAAVSKKSDKQNIHNLFQHINARSSKFSTVQYGAIEINSFKGTVSLKLLKSFSFANLTNFLDMSESKVITLSDFKQHIAWRRYSKKLVVYVGVGEALYFGQTETNSQINSIVASFVNNLEKRGIHVVYTTIGIDHNVYSQFKWWTTFGAETINLKNPLVFLDYDLNSYFKKFHGIKNIFITNIESSEEIDFEIKVDCKHFGKTKFDGCYDIASIPGTSSHDIKFTISIRSKKCFKNGPRTLVFEIFGFGNLEIHTSQACGCQEDDLLKCEPCPSDDQNQVCSGPSKGVCHCGVCQCKNGFHGSSCQFNACPNEPKKSLDCKDNYGMTCGLQGSCDCGVCKCFNNYLGPFCHTCNNCDSKCDKYKSFVEIAYDNPSKYFYNSKKEANRTKDICPNCFVRIVNNMKEFENNVCTFKHSNCDVHYVVREINGKVFVIMKEKNQSDCQLSAAFYTTEAIYGIGLFLVIAMIIYIIVKIVFFTMVKKKVHSPSDDSDESNSKLETKQSQTIQPLLHQTRSVESNDEEPNVQIAQETSLY